MQNRVEEAGVPQVDETRAQPALLPAKKERKVRRGDDKLKVVALLSIFPSFISRSSRYLNLLSEGPHIM